MGNTDYRNAYEVAAGELNALLEQQEKLEDRILALRKTMNALSTLCQQEGFNTTNVDRAYGRLREMADSSITDDIRRILSAAKEPLTAGDVREEMNKLGGSLAEHSNPLATIHAVLGRLAESGFARETLKGEKKAWMKVHPLDKLRSPFKSASNLEAALRQKREKK
jgi:hypothetical protein